jgi:putative acyl-CoA dehydrogenase
MRYRPDDAPEATLKDHMLLGETHSVENVVRELVDFNLYLQDAALQEAVRREGAAWAHDDLAAFGELTGKGDYLALGALANRYGPELETHDRFGNRVDLVTFNPAYHALMKTSIEHGLHSSPWTDPKPGAHVARAARSYMHTQVDAGHGCPITMTFAAVPSLRTTPELATAGNRGSLRESMTRATCRIRTSWD